MNDHLFPNNNDHGLLAQHALDVAWNDDACHHCGTTNPPIVCAVSTDRVRMLSGRCAECDYEADDTTWPDTVRTQAIDLGTRARMLAAEVRRGEDCVHDFSRQMTLLGELAGAATMIVCPVLAYLVSAVRRPGRVTFAHAMARLTPDQRRAIQLRYLDGYPRDLAARLMNRSKEAVRCLQRRAIRRMQQTVTTAGPLGLEAAA